MLGQQDSVGLVTFDDQPRDHLPPRSRPSHLREILRALTADASRRETDLGTVFQKLAPKLHRRGLLIILSDSMGEVSELGRALAHFRAQHHEVIFFQILDPDELDFPFSGRTQFVDLEQASNEQTVDAKSLRDAYLERLAEHNAELRAACRSHRVDWVPLVTTQPYAMALAEYLAYRRRVS